MKFENVLAERPQKVIYRDGDRCVKVFVPTYNKAAIYNEASNHVRIEETGLNIPKVLGVENIDGGWAIVTQFIEGKTLEQLIAEHPENKLTYFRTFADLQASIHTKDCPYLYRLKDELNQKIAVSELEATIRYDLHNKLEEMAKGMSICHGDFCASNIILSSDGVYYVVDWTLASFGNPLADVAQTYIMFWINNSYEDAELYLDMYCGEAGVDKEKVYEWLSIIGAAMSARRPENEKKVLLECVNSLDFKNHMKSIKFN